MKLLMEVININNSAGEYLHIRTGPSTGYPVTGKLYNGNQIVAIETSNGWYKSESGGWSYGNYLKVLKNLEEDSVATPAQPETTEETLTSEDQELLNSIYTKTDVSSTNIDNMRYIFGLPFQFTELTDPRPSGSLLGRSYIETILSDMSLLVLIPGTAAFMTHASSAVSKKVIAKLVSLGAEDNENMESLQEILEGKQVGRYYTFESKYSEYIKYVNNMCRISATLLGIGDETLYEGSAKFKNFDWDIAKLKGDSAWYSFLTTEKSVGFFIDGKDSSFSDGMTNSTRDSTFKSATAQLSDYAKEAYFLLGQTYSDESILKTSLSNFESAVSKIVGNITSDNSLARQFTDRMSDSASTIINGGNIAFPQIYDDSSYSSSYSIKFKLVSPYGDPLSLYLNIFVPLWHLVALSYPLQTGANGYTNPFLVRAFCKSWFNCSLGIITSISIDKASQDGWNVLGMPTEVDVSITISNLYENQTISRAGDFSTFHNTEYLDMLSTWCGVNINQPELSRKISLYTSFISNAIRDVIPNVSEVIRENISNKILQFLR